MFGMGVQFATIDQALKVMIGVLTVVYLSYRIFLLHRNGKE
jgi:hypothetical protein